MIVKLIVYVYVITQYALSLLNNPKRSFGLNMVHHHYVLFFRESNFPRLGQMIIDYENPFKKLSEEFTPHAQRVGIALNSLNLLFKRRNIGGEQVSITFDLSLNTFVMNLNAFSFLSN